MGKILKKSGFLGLGKPIEEWYCDKCNQEIHKKYHNENKVYCEQCANSIDLSIVHGWSSPEIVEKYHLKEFFTDTLDGQQKHIDQCHNCEGLTVHINKNGQFTRKYYQVGFKDLKNSVFKCEYHGGYDENGNVKKQANCHHSWLVISSTKNMGKEAQEKYKKMMSSRNYMVESMYGTDEIDIQYFCFGATYYWCSKCGLYRRLNPQREHLLPVFGLKNA